MDENQFAAITRAMGRELTRRGALGRLAVGLLGAAGLSRFTAAPAVAACELGVNCPSGDGIQPQPATLDNQVDRVCPLLGYDFGVKLNDPAAGSSGPVPGTGGSEAISYSLYGGDENNTYFDWSSNFLVGTVVVKGGSNQQTNANNVYTYPNGDKGDTNLHAPINDNNGKPFGVSHVIFCWNKPLDVSKTAKTSYDRDWTWTVAKSADQSSLKLSVGQTFTPVSYTVKYDATKADANFKVEGKITIKNPNPSAVATITNVTDEIDQGGPPTAATVNCGVNFPYNLADGGELVCTYSATLTSKTDGKNTAKVTTDGKVPGGSGKADVTFGAPSNETDECVTVSDSNTGTNVSGQVCAPADTPKTFNYSRSVGPYSTCGDYTVDNTASFETNDNKEKGSSTWTIKVNVPCAGGCTLTQGYWKTHSEKGPAPYDDTWAKLANGANTPFFLSGKSYYEVLWTPPAGNPYYTLAHQYIAAELNILNGADGSAVSSQMTAAKTLFMSNTPTQVATGGKTVQNKFKALVGPLDNYNNGVTGPGHCSENSAVSAQETAARSGPSKKSRKQHGKRGKGHGHGRK
jgi:hypothetical protein